MNDDLLKFIRKNNVSNLIEFISLLNEKIAVRESIISSNNMLGVYFDSEQVEVVPLSKIVGCSQSDLLQDKSYLSNFGNFFDSRSGDSYHSRSISLLDISVESIMDELDLSLQSDPIKTISIDGDYFIAGNGLHRFMALKMFYMLELHQGKTRQELDEKYKIRITNRNVDVFRTYASVIGTLFNPPVRFTDDMTKHEWLELAKERINNFQNNQVDYQIFINNIVFNYFSGGEPGEALINFLNTYFPTIFKDVVKNICSFDYYESLIEIVDCFDKKFPGQKSELMQLIDNYMPKSSQNTEEKGYKFFDLDVKWNGYGMTKNLISEIKSKRDIDLETFSEGSLSLEKCLKLFWKRDVITTACCKGDHLSMGVDNKPIINCESYISFDSGCDWQSYLSPEIIEDDDVIITEHAIYYYGRNKDEFFDLLSYNLITGKKTNSKELNVKVGKEASQDMEYKSFICSLQEIGFDELQIAALSESYLDIVKWSNMFYSSSLEDENKIKEIENNWSLAQKRLDEDLAFYINRNNQAISDMKI